VVIGSGQSGDWQCSKWCLTIVKVVVDGGDRFFFYGGKSDIQRWMKW